MSTGAVVISPADVNVSASVSLKCADTDGALPSPGNGQSNGSHSTPVPASSASPSAGTEQELVADAEQFHALQLKRLGDLDRMIAVVEASLQQMTTSDDSLPDLASGDCNCLPSAVIVEPLS